MTITLSVTTEVVCCTIEDDGRGFDPALVTEGGYGLVGFNKRVRLLEDSLRLVSDPGVGMRIEVVIPL